MMPKESKYGGWAASGELDILEYRGDKHNEISGTIHYGGSWPNNTNTGTTKTTEVDFSQDYHTFAGIICYKYEYMLNNA